MLLAVEVLDCENDFISDPLLTAHSAANGGVWALTAWLSISATWLVQPRLDPGLLLPGDSAHVTLRPFVFEPSVLKAGLAPPMSDLESKRSTEPPRCKKASF